MQWIHVLRTQEKSLSHLALQLREGEVCGIRLAVQTVSPAHCVKAPHPLRVFLPCLGSRNFFHPVSIPKAIVVTKGRQTALRAHAGAGQHKYPVIGSDLNCVAHSLTSFTDYRYDHLFDYTMLKTCFPQATTNSCESPTPLRPTRRDGRETGSNAVLDVPNAASESSPSRSWTLFFCARASPTSNSRILCERARFVGAHVNPWIVSSRIFPETLKLVSLMRTTRALLSSRMANLVPS